MNLISNKPFPEKFQIIYDSLFASEKPLFTVVGDIAISGKYGDSAICFFKNKLVVFDSSFKEQYETFDYDTISSVKIKRMYSHACFFLTDKSGKNRKIMRFSFGAAVLADAAAFFVNRVIADGYSDEFLDGVENTYNHMKSYCPKCGRTLPSPNAKCIVCEGDKKGLLSKLMGYIMPYKWTVIFCIVLSIFTTAMALVPPYITGYMVDNVLPQKNMNGLLTIIGLLLGIYILQYSITAIKTYIIRVTGDKMVTALRKDIYNKAQYLPMDFYDKTSTGSLMTRINNDANGIKDFVIRISQEAIVQFFTMVGILIIMIVLDWKLALYSMIPVPLVMLLGYMFGIKIEPRYLRLWKRNVVISDHLTDNIPGMRIIKAFTSEKTTIKKFDDACDDWVKEDKGAARLAAIFPALMTFLVTCGSLIIWFVGGMSVINGSGRSLGLLVSFVSYAGMFYVPINFFAGFNENYQYVVSVFQKIVDILDYEPEQNFGKKLLVDNIEGKVEFKNVSFSFDRAKKILSNISFTIEPGDIVGIVGTTGSGKTTLINLLLRYYDKYEGDILVDGINIKDIDIHSYRKNIGFVQQEPYMFKDTIRNNIAYGSENVGTDKIMEASEVANAHYFITRLPEGYDTMLGERGVGLSGGEKQRISIARAIIKDPKILVFDEATASVDSETEELIQQAIDRLISGRTTFMIAHRLSTLRNANKIIVVDQGEIIEFGTPEELLALKGKYYKLVQIQALGEQLKKSKREENFE